MSARAVAIDRVAHRLRNVLTALALAESRHGAAQWRLIDSVADLGEDGDDYLVLLESAAREAFHELRRLLDSSPTDVMVSRRPRKAEKRGLAA